MNSRVVFLIMLVFALITNVTEPFLAVSNKLYQGIGTKVSVLVLLFMIVWTLMEISDQLKALRAIKPSTANQESFQGSHTLWMSIVRKKNILDVCDCDIYKGAVDYLRSTLGLDKVKIVGSEAYCTSNDQNFYDQVYKLHLTGVVRENWTDKSETWVCHYNLLVDVKNQIAMLIPAD